MQIIWLASAIKLDIGNNVEGTSDNLLRVRDQEIDEFLGAFSRFDQGEECRV